jgi:hypothetical protein
MGGLTDASRREFALKYRAFLDAKVPRKSALLKVQQEIRAIDPSLPCSRTQIYVWCKKFGISTR